MNKLLTIIVPTYNMEEYLHKCLSSLIIDDESLMNELDIIVVNDGSTDSTSVIAHSYEEKYPGIFRVIDKENGNYGSCINRGVKEAKGTFIKTLDADDYYDTEGLKGFLQLLQKTEADVVVHYCQSEDAEGVRGGFHGFSPDYYESHCQGKTIFTLEEIAGVAQLHPHVYNMAYRTDILRNLKYSQLENVFYSDTQWRIIPMAFVKTLEVFPHVVYRYFLGREGQSVAFDNRRKYFFHEVNLVKRLYEDYNKIEFDDITRLYVDNCILGHLHYLYTWGINNEMFNEYEVRALDKNMKELSPKHWQQMNNWVVNIHAYRHSVTVDFWRKWDGRWFYLLEGILGFFWDPYKKLKEKFKTVL